VIGEPIWDDEKKKGGYDMDQTHQRQGHHNRFRSLHLRNDDDQQERRNQVYYAEPPPRIASGNVQNRDGPPEEFRPDQFNILRGHGPDEYLLGVLIHQKIEVRKGKIKGNLNEDNKEKERNEMPLLRNPDLPIRSVIVDELFDDSAKRRIVTS